MHRRIQQAIFRHNSIRAVGGLISVAGLRCAFNVLDCPLSFAEDVYLDRDDNFQVDVEELMVMEAIRLSLLESHTQGMDNFLGLTNGRGSSI
jgi:hypothetical protein